MVLRTPRTALRLRPRRWARGVFLLLEGQFELLGCRVCVVGGGGVVGVEEVEDGEGLGAGEGGGVEDGLEGGIGDEGG